MKLQKFPSVILAIIYVRCC